MSTVRAVLFEPTDFFRRLPPRGSALNPVLFALLCALIPAPLALLVEPFDPLAGDEPGIYESLSGSLAGLGLGEVALLVIVVLILVLIVAPLTALLGLYIGAGILHLLVLLFVRPANTDFEATLRAYSYASATALLSWIPVIGILADLYSFYLTFVGIRELHNTTSERALLAVVFVPAILIVALLFFFLSRVL